MSYRGKTHNELVAEILKRDAQLSAALAEIRELRAIIANKAATP
jgi:hypothetical protein